MELKSNIEIGQVNGCLILKIIGYANHLDATMISKFLENIIKKSTDNQFASIIFEMSECSKMDSTFMGLIASIVCEDKGGVEFSLLNCRGVALECLEDLGLTKIVKISQGPIEKAVSYIPLKTLEWSSGEREEIIRITHEALSQISEANRKKFSGVIKALNDKAKGAKK